MPKKAALKRLAATMCGKVRGNVSSEEIKGEK
jgi:hypothetical protein